MPSVFAWLVAVVHYESQLFLLALGVIWNTLIDYICTCLDLYGNSQLSLENIVYYCLLPLATAGLSLLCLHHLKAVTVTPLLSSAVTDPTLDLLHSLCPPLAFALTWAPFSLMSTPPSSHFSGSLQDFSQIADNNNDMASEYGLDEGEAPDSPIHPDNNFLSQVAQPGSTLLIISTVHMALMPLPASCSASHALSANTICDAHDSAKPYGKTSPSSSTKSWSKAVSCTPSHTSSPVSSVLPILAVDWSCFMDLYNNWHE